MPRLTDDVDASVAAADVGSLDKWMGTPVWSHHGLLCAADAHTNIVKVIFFKGASLPDPDGLFNAELGGNARRAIKFFEGDPIDELALKSLGRASVVSTAPNRRGKRRRTVNEAVPSPVRSSAERDADDAG